MKNKEQENLENEEQKCHCDEGQCTCGQGEHDCGCHGDCENGCHCGDKCECQGECNCGDDCNCGDECQCGDDCDCGKDCGCHKENDSDKYLNLARQIQADFENYRRHAAEDIDKARLAGQVSVLDAFLPALDTFREAKKSISDEVVLKGVTMIEDKIVEALKNLGVEKIPAVGEVYNPRYHNAIAVMKDSEKENDIILEEYQAGYIFKDKVIRYSKVIVNKKED